MNAAPHTTTEPHWTAADRLLVDPEWLEEHLHDPRIRVVEVDVSPATYTDWHIDGAVLWNIYTDLKTADYTTIGASEVEELMRRSGIDADTAVVFYGYAPCFGLWLLTHVGHRDVRILNCSRTTWRARGYRWTTDVTRVVRGSVHLGPPDPGTRADRTAVRNAIGAPDTVLVDVRSWDEYRGERFWPSGGMDPHGRAGHVPTAVHQPLEDLVRDDGSFRSVPDLRRALRAVGNDDDTELITYCTIGGRAATAWFVLHHLLGRKRVRVYDGSWAEWGRWPDAPVAR
jgi:thiosulfate/3-mercaptopyruvate sulfurtransferase